MTTSIYAKGLRNPGFISHLNISCKRDAFPGGSVVKESTHNAGASGDLDSIPGLEDPLEGTATHSRILAWRIPMDRGAWRDTVHGSAKSQTQLK